MSDGRAPRGGVRYVVLTWIPEERFAAWDAWHRDVHVPHVLAAPQVRGATRRRVRDTTLPGGWDPQVATIYRFASLADYEAYRDGPGVALRREYEEHYGGVGRIARLVLDGDDLDPTGRDS